LHLVALASGEVKPSDKPARAVGKKPAAKKSGKQSKTQNDAMETFLATSVMAKPKPASKSRRRPGAD